MERLVPMGAVFGSPWPAAAASMALHGALAIALMAASFPPRPPEVAPLAIDVIMVSKAPYFVDATDQAGNEDIAEDASPLAEIRPRQKPEPPQKPERMKQTHATLPPSKLPRTEEIKSARATKAQHLTKDLQKITRPVNKTSIPARRGPYPSGLLIAATFRQGSAENPRPLYPRLARLRGWEGRVVLLVTVASNGTPEAIKVETSSGFTSLDKAAIKAVKRWRFQPARLAGTSIAGTVHVPIRFELANE